MVRLVSAGRAAPRHPPLHRPLHQAVRALGVGGTVLPDRTVDKPQVLQQQDNNFAKTDR